jgi:hypothetical protein
MKKVICIIAVVLMIATVVYAQKRTPIAAKDVAGLKGTWEGIVSFGVTADAGSSPCKLEILNDAVPLKGKFTINNVPDLVASRLGLTAGQHVAESDDGTLTSQGTIVWTGPQKNMVEIAKSGDKKVQLNYWFKGLRGDATLTKKK